MPASTMSTEELLTTVWMKELKEILTKFPTKSCEPIALLSADYTYRNVLLNWLISATVVLKPPVNNILVLTLDKYLYEMLKTRRIPSIHVDPTTILNPSYSHKKSKPPLIKCQIMISRVTVTRFLNHWGFNVITYDIDAIIMQNPQMIYEEYSEEDIIGSYGTSPKWLYKKWGFTLCGGVILIRSSPRTGE